MSEYPILTHKMKTAQGDYLGSNAEFFFPFDEGSGNNTSDATGKYSFTKTGAEHAVLNAITQGWANSNRTDSNVVGSPKGKHILIFAVGNVLLNTALFELSVGSSSTFLVKVNSGTGFSMDGSSGPVINAGVEAYNIGDNTFLAGTFNKKTGEMRSYSAKDGAQIAFRNTADGSAFINDMASISNTIVIGLSSMDQMAAGLLYLDSLPSEADLLAMLNVSYANFVSGKKYYDTRLKNY